MRQRAYLQKRQQLRLYHKLSSIIYHSNNFKKEEGDWIKHYATSIDQMKCPSCDIHFHPQTKYQYLGENKKESS